MPIEDVDVPQSAGWWLRRLINAQNARPSLPAANLRESRRANMGRRDWMDLLWSYYIGEPPLPRASRGHAEATREFLRMARATYGQLAVDALLDRLTLQGVRTGADGDTDGDDEVRRIMAANGTWLNDTLAFSFAVGLGYAMVGPGDSPDTPLITAEDPRQLTVAADPVRPDVARAAVKVYRDDDLGEEIAHLFLPAGVDPVTGERVNDRELTAVRNAGAAGSRFVSSSW